MRNQLLTVGPKPNIIKCDLRDVFAERTMQNQERLFVWKPGIFSVRDCNNRSFGVFKLPWVFCEQLSGYMFSCCNYCFRFEATIIHKSKNCAFALRPLQRRGQLAYISSYLVHSKYLATVVKVETKRLNKPYMKGTLNCLRNIFLIDGSTTKICSSC